jgi:hypothetical protein
VSHVAHSMNVRQTTQFPDLSQRNWVVINFAHPRTAVPCSDSIAPRRKGVGFRNRSRRKTTAICSTHGELAGPSNLSEM